MSTKKEKIERLNSLPPDIPHHKNSNDVDDLDVEENKRLRFLDEHYDELYP